MLLVYNYVLLKMSTWCSKHAEESNILRINNSQCIKLVINVWSIKFIGQILSDISYVSAGGRAVKGDKQHKLFRYISSYQVNVLILTNWSPATCSDIVGLCYWRLYGLPSLNWWVWRDVTFVYRLMDGIITAPCVEVGGSDIQINCDPWVNLLSLGWGQ